jgi:hypothetical protein
MRRKAEVCLRGVHYNEQKESIAMAKVFGIHAFEPLPGVLEEEFEKFILEQARPALTGGSMDVEMYLLKGDKGERVGKYLVLLAMDSVETRNRIYGPPGGPPPERSEAQRKANEAIVAKYRTLGTTSWPFTDYVVVGE